MSVCAAFAAFSAAFNRTIVELKANIWNDPAKPLQAFNRTIVELKVAFGYGYYLKEGAFNRTIVELKENEKARGERNAIF